MLLLVSNRIPPDVEEAICPRAAVDEEGSQIETSTVLRYDEIDGVSPTIPVCRSSYRIEVGIFDGMRNIERVVDVDVTIGIG